MHGVTVLFVRWLLRNYPWAFGLLVLTTVVAVIITFMVVPPAPTKFVPVTTTTRS